LRPHTLFLNPTGHVGVRNVPSSWTEKNDDGRIVGKPMTIAFINGRFDADERLADYLVANSFAQREPWQPPQDDAADPFWRWREGKT
jgi:hypothetical protein